MISALNMKQPSGVKRCTYVIPLSEARTFSCRNNRETHLTGKHSPGESKGVKLRKLTLIHKYLILNWLQIFTPKMRLQPS